MPKTVTERPDFVLIARCDAGGFVGATVEIVDDAGHRAPADLDVVAASQAAVTPLAGAGINLTAAQIRTVWRQLAAQGFAQAKAALGY